MKYLMIYKHFMIIHCIYIIYMYNTVTYCLKICYFIFQIYFQAFLKLLSFDLDIFDFYENLQNTVEITSNRSWCKKKNISF